MKKRKRDIVPNPAHVAGVQNIGCSAHGLVERLKDLTAALDCDTAGVTIFDSVGELAYVNKAFSTVYGIELPATIIGSRTQELHALLAPTCLLDIDAQTCLVLSHALGAQQIQEQRIITLSNGRVVQICHYPQPRGGWITRHTVAGDVNSPSALTQASSRCRPSSIKSPITSG